MRQREVFRNQIEGTVAVFIVPPPPLKELKLDQNSDALTSLVCEEFYSNKKIQNILHIITTIIILYIIARYNEVKLSNINYSVFIFKTIPIESKTMLK